ncbi:MAG: excinuclease ABC subunit UvrC [Clostridiales Family XIII bacterium]|jgi:excinuclease ABC subunit C|nr:excinuclease ABC subunit UvrC [Clostridiales Family XIII bacterium]
MFDIKENLKRLPGKPGVYLHKDKYGEVIYVGKAASLKSRVRQYFAPPGSLDAKTRALARNIAEFEYIVTGTEAEALILENTLIKKHRPRFNVMLLDDKTYPYIKITYGEAYPRVVKTRTLKNDGSKYFGPYADVGALNRIVELLNDSYRLKRCSRRDFPAGWRPCLNGFIGGCDRCCMADGPTPAEYASRIEDVVLFLKGRDKHLVASLRAGMKEAADAMDFETAAKRRDLIASAEAVTERQKVDLLSSGNMDVILASEAVKAAEPGTGQEGSTRQMNRPLLSAHATVFFVRDGRLTGREIHHLDAEEGALKKEITAAFLKQYYANQTMFPKEILLEERIEDQAAIENYLSEAAGHKVKLSVPERGDRRALLRLAQKDIRETEALAGDMLAARLDRDAAAEGALRRVIAAAAPPAGGTKGDGSSVLQSKTDEPSPFVLAQPLRIEAYDISHTGGEDSVGAMVVFRGAEKSRADYRRFKIRTADEGGNNADDYAAMQEVIYRRLKRGLAGEKGFGELPDVILVDGGKGHAAAAEQIISAMKPGRPIPVLGMVKDDRHRTRGLVSGGIETDLTQTPELYRLVGTIQEEVHRFAVEYHRGVRGKKLTKSELDDIKGIGEKRKRALLLKYGGVEGVRAAAADELAAVPGMGRAAAEAVAAHFRSR